MIRNPNRQSRTPGRRRGRRLRQPWRWIPFRGRLLWARLRRLAVRHRLVARGLAVLIVGAVSLGAASSYLAGREAVARWGVDRRVVVMTEAAAIGQPVGGSSFHVAALPAAVVPHDALTAAPDPVDRFVAPKVAGEVLTRRDLASSRPGTVSAPAGTRAIALPTGPDTPPLSPGDRVDLLLVHDPFGVTAGPPVELSPPAIVLLIGDDAVTVAVPPGQVGEIAETLTSGRVAVALR